MDEIEEENRRQFALDDMFQKRRNVGYDIFKAPSDIDYLNEEEEDEQSI